MSPLMLINKFISSEYKHALVDLYSICSRITVIVLLDVSIMPNITCGSSSHLACVSYLSTSVLSGTVRCYILTFQHSSYFFKKSWLL